MNFPRAVFGGFFLRVFGSIGITGFPRQCDPSERFEMPASMSLIN